MPRKPILPKPEVQERQRRALELHKAGLNYREIAEKLGYATSASASAAAKAALLRNLPDEPQDAKLVELERLDRLFAAVWQKASTGEDDAAMDRALKIIAARERLRSELSAITWKGKRPTRSEEQADETDSIAKILAILEEIGVLPTPIEIVDQAEDD